MAQDYANKPRSKGPSARKNTTKAAPPPRSKLPWLGGLGVLLLAGLGFGLYQLAGVKPDPQATQQQVQAVAEQKAAPAKKAVTPKPVAKPEEKSYTFYQMLPNSKVEAPQVDAYKSTPKSAADYSNYLLQAGSFRSAADADSLRAKLIIKGLPNVTTSPVTSSSGSLWYRVRLGPFESRSRLNKAYDTLVRMNLQPLRIKLAKDDA